MNKHFLTILLTMMDSIKNNNTRSWLDKEIQSSIHGEFLEKLWNNPEEVCKQKTSIVNLVKEIKEALEIDSNPEVHRLAADDIINGVEKFYWKKESGVVQDFMSEDDFISSLFNLPTWVNYTKVYQPGDKKPWFIKTKKGQEMYKRKTTWEMTPETSYRFMSQNSCTSIKLVKMGFAQLVAFHSDNNAIDNFCKENSLDAVPSEMKHLFVALRKGDKVEETLMGKWKRCRTVDNAKFLLAFAKEVAVELSLDDVESLTVRAAFDIGSFHTFLEEQAFVQNVFETYYMVQPFFAKTSWDDISAEGRKDFAGNMKRLAKAIEYAEAAQMRMYEEYVSESDDYNNVIERVSESIQYIKDDMLEHWNMLVIKQANLSMADESFYSLQKKLVINVRKVLGIEVLNIEESMQGNAFQGADVLGKIYPKFKESTFSCSIDIEKGVDSAKGWQLVAQACKELKIVPVGGSVFAKLFDKDGNPSMPTLLADAMFDNFSSFIAYFNSLTNAPAKAALCNSEMHLPMNDACSVVIYNAKSDIIGESVRASITEKLKEASSHFTDEMKIFPSLLAGVDGSGLNSTGVKAQIRGFVEGAEKHDGSLIPKHAAYFKGLSVDGFICEFNDNPLYTIWNAIADGHVSVLDSKEEWFRFVRDNGCKPVFAIEKGMVKGWAKAHLGKILGGNDVSIGEVLEANGGFVKVDRTTYGWSILPCPLGTGTSSSFQLQVMLKADPLHFMYLSKQATKEGLLDQLEVGTPEYKATKRMLRNMVEIYESPADLEKELTDRFYPRYVSNHSEITSWINNIVTFFKDNSVKLQDHLTNRFYRKVESTGDEVKDQALLNLIDKVVKDPSVNSTVKGALRPWLENPSKYLWRMASTGLDKKYDWRRLVMADFASSQAFKSFVKDLDEGAKAWWEKALNFSGLTIATSNHNSLKPELAAGWRGPLLVKDAVQLNMVINPETLRAWVKGEKIFVSADEDPIDLVECIRPHMEVKHGSYETKQLEIMLFNLYANSMVLNLDEKIMLMHTEDVEDGQGDDDGDTWCLEFDKDIVRLFAASIKRWRKYHPNKVSIELSKKAQIDYSDAFSVDEEVRNKAIQRYGFDMSSLGGRVPNPLGWNYAYLREKLDALMQDQDLVDFGQFVRKVGVNPQGPAVGPFSNISVDIMSRVDVEKLGQDDESNNLLFQGYKTSSFGVQISIDFAKRMVEILNAMLYGLKKDGKFVVDFDKEITAEFLEEWGCGNQDPEYNVACVTKDSVTKYYFVGKFEIPNGYSCDNYLSEAAFKKLEQDPSIEVELEMRTWGSVLCPDTMCFDFNFCYHFAQVAMQLDKDSVCIWKESPMAILKNKELQEKVRLQLKTMMPNKFTQNFGIFMSLLENEAFVRKVNITETLMKEFSNKQLSEEAKVEGLLNRLRVCYAKMMAEESTPWGDKKKISSTAKSLRLLDAYFGGLDRDARRNILADAEVVSVIVKDLMVLDQWANLDDAPKQLLWQVIVEGHVEISTELEPSARIAKQTQLIEKSVEILVDASLQGFYKGVNNHNVFPAIVQQNLSWLLEGKSFVESDFAKSLEGESFVKKHENGSLMFANTANAGVNHVLLLQASLKYLRRFIVKTQVNNPENAIKAFTEVLDFCEGDLFGAFRTYGTEYKKAFTKLQSLLRLIPHYIPLIPRNWFEYSPNGFVQGVKDKQTLGGFSDLWAKGLIDYQWFTSSKWFKPEAWIRKALMGTPEMPGSFEGFDTVFEHCARNGVSVVSKSYFKNDGIKTPDVLVMTCLFNRGHIMVKNGALQLQDRPGESGLLTSNKGKALYNAYCYKNIQEYIMVAGLPLIDRGIAVWQKDPLGIHGEIINRLPIMYNTNCLGFQAYDSSNKKYIYPTSVKTMDLRNLFQAMQGGQIEEGDTTFKAVTVENAFKRAMQLSLIAYMDSNIGFSQLPNVVFDKTTIKDRLVKCAQHLDVPRHFLCFDKKAKDESGNEVTQAQFFGPAKDLIDGKFAWTPINLGVLKSYLNYTQLFTHDKTIWCKEMRSPMYLKAKMPLGHFDSCRDLQTSTHSKIQNLFMNPSKDGFDKVFQSIRYGNQHLWQNYHHVNSIGQRYSKAVHLKEGDYLIAIFSRGVSSISKANGKRFFGNKGTPVEYFRTQGGHFNFDLNDAYMVVVKR